MSLKPEDRVMVMAPLVRGRKGEFKQELAKLAQHGYVRARIDGELRNLDEELDEIQLDKRKNHTIEVVIDRLLVKPGIEKRLEQLERYHRPILCTEFMARSLGSTFDTILPIAYKHHVAAINWGLVAGKTQTYLPWDSWQRPYVIEEPPVWFHEVFHPNGTPYREREVEIIRELAGKSDSVRGHASVH